MFERRAAVPEFVVAERKRELLRQAEERGMKAGKRRPIHPQWVGYQLGLMMEKDAILVNDGTLRVFPGRDLPDRQLACAPVENGPRRTWYRCPRPVPTGRTRNGPRPRARKASA